MIEAYLAYETWEIELGTTNRIKRAALAQGAKWDERDKVELIRDLRAEGKLAYPAWAPSVYWDSNGIPYGNDRWLPLGSVSNSYQVFCQEQGPWMVYKSDEHGFNNPPGLYNAGNLDAALVGDSFTHGACALDGDDMAGVMRRNGDKVLTFGIGGTGPLTYLAQQREYAKPLRPKYVFWMFYAVDVRDVVYEDKAEVLRRYYDPSFSNRFIERQPEIDAFLTDFLDHAYEQKLNELTVARAERRKIITDRLISEGLQLKRLRERIEHFGGRAPVTEGNEERKLELVRRVLTVARDEAREWGGQVVFVYLPDWYSYGAKYDTYGIKVDDNFLLRQDVLKTARDLGLPVIDLKSEIFDRQADPLSLYNWRTYGHYNPAGYKLIGDRLTRFIKQHD